MSGSDRQTDSLFPILAAAARARSSASLAGQIVICAGFAVLVVASAPRWWPVACLLGGPISYAAWGLGDRLIRGMPARVWSIAFAIAGTGASLLGMVGLALLLFTGHARGVKEPCGPGATSRWCRAYADPPLASRPVFPLSDK